MTVQLDTDNYVLAWGDQIVGRDIPDPPETGPNERALWDDSADSWTIEQI